MSSIRVCSTQSTKELESLTYRFIELANILAQRGCRRKEPTSACLSQLVGDNAQTEVEFGIAGPGVLVVAFVENRAHRFMLAWIHWHLGSLPHLVSLSLFVPEQRTGSQTDLSAPDGERRVRMSHNTSTAPRHGISPHATIIGSKA